MEPRSPLGTETDLTTKPDGKDRVGKPISRDEVSGLHEIKALAANAIDRQRVRRSTEQPVQAEAEALMNASPAASGNVVLPQPGREVRIELPSVQADAPVAAGAIAQASGAPKKSRAGLFAVIAVLVIGGAGGAWYAMRGAPEASPPVAAAPAAPPQAPAPVAPAAAPSEQAVAQPLDDKPADEPAAQVAPPGADQAHTQVAGNPADNAVAGVAKDNGATKATAEKGTKPEGKPAATDAIAAVTNKPEAAPTPTPAAEPKRGNSGDDELGALLDGQGGGEKAAPADDAPALPEKLSPGDVKTGMAAVKARVQGCYDKYQQAGAVKIKAKIEPDGTVSTAEASGEFAGTDTGTCVANAVKNAKFPKTSGQGLAITYPFVLAAE